MKEPINVNGKRLNKLEEVVKLLQKLNEDFYSKDALEQEGYPIKILLGADGSGCILQDDYPEILFRFKDTNNLEAFLKGSRLTQLNMGRCSMWEELKEKK